MNRSMMATMGVSVLSLLLATTPFALEKEHKVTQSEKGYRTTQPAQRSTEPRGTTMRQDENEKLPMRMSRGSKLIGADVENTQGEDLGDITDIVINRADGSVVYAVLSAGGFLGIGDKYFAIPMEAFKPAADDEDKLILDIDKQRLSNAPGFDKNNWPDMANEEWGSQIYAYYGISPSWAQREARQQQQAKGAYTSPSTTARQMEAIPAKVQNVDKNNGTATVELRIPETLRQDLEAGDSVEVMLHKNMPQSKPMHQKQ
jgi:sporulation protein YlmC with PRC-barrel domain